MTDQAALPSDRPSTDPAQDLFGHAPFAMTLSKAIRNYRASDGIVLALYGPWGSGKSTVLAYVLTLSGAPGAMGGCSRSDCSKAITMRRIGPRTQPSSIAASVSSFGSRLRLKSAGVSR